MVPFDVRTITFFFSNKEQRYKLLTTLRVLCFKLERAGDVTSGTNNLFLLASTVRRDGAIRHSCRFKYRKYIENATCVKYDFRLDSSVSLVVRNFTSTAIICCQTRFKSSGSVVTVSLVKDNAHHVRIH